MYSKEEIDSLFERQMTDLTMGRHLFNEMFSDITLTDKDGFIMVLTDNAEILSIAYDCIPEYRSRLKGNLYVISETKIPNITDKEWRKAPKEDIHRIATYLHMMPQKLYKADTYVFLTDHDEYGIQVEEYLEKGLISLEEYVRIGLFGPA